MGGGGGGESLYKMTGRMFKASIVPLALYQQAVLKENLPWSKINQWDQNQSAKLEVMRKQGQVKLFIYFQLQHQ